MYLKKTDMERPSYIRNTCIFVKAVTNLPN